jgi:hypothetical protein
MNTYSYLSLDPGENENNKIIWVSHIICCSYVPCVTWYSQLIFVDNILLISFLRKKRDGMRSSELGDHETFPSHPTQ